MLFKITHFVATTEGMTVKELTRLFKNNIWKLDRGLQFAAELIKELNKMLGIETRLAIVFHPQMDGQME